MDSMPKFARFLVTLGIAFAIMAVEEYATRRFGIKGNAACVGALAWLAAWRIYDWR